MKFYKFKKEEALNDSKKQSQWREVARRFFKNKPAVLGLIIISFVILIAICAPLIVDYDKTITIDAANRLQGPSAEHIFGTDQLGRDVFARVVHGARYSLSIGFIATIIALSIGVFIGAAVGYYGGKVDTIVMRFMDVVTCIPPILFTLVIVSVFGRSLTNLLLAMSLSSVPSYVRLVRSTVLSLTDQEYIEAAKSYGTSTFEIIWKHVLPNAIGPIIVAGTGDIAGTILQAAGLSFLGFGVQAPTPEWGVMLSEARDFMRTAPHLMIFPGLVMVISALSINLIGDGLRDALDPRLKD